MARTLIVELRGSDALHQVALAGGSAAPLIGGVTSAVGNVVVDPEYPPVQIDPASDDWAEVHAMPQASVGRRQLRPTSRFAARVTVDDDDDYAGTVTRLRGRPEVVAVRTDVVISSTIQCKSEDPLGAEDSVATGISRAGLHAAGLDGSGVLLAIVDSGLNLPHLTAAGRDPQFSSAFSWKPTNVFTVSGNHPPGHGTMCAFGATIAAPKATLVDHAILFPVQNQGFEGLLSNALHAYAKLRTVLSATAPSLRRMVVNNSWALAAPHWDIEPGLPGNYSDDPGHTFTEVVRDLESMGADIVFAAGNCGSGCPAQPCGFTHNPITGANSEPNVLCVTGVDVTGAALGYTSHGPGRLAAQKPDVAGYTHFRGSGIGSVDSGTSAAAGVVSGIIAAVRTQYAADVLPPARLRELIRLSAHKNPPGFDYQTGYGVINVQALLPLLP